MFTRRFPMNAVALAVALGVSHANAADLFISEIHYDNSGTDTGEAIEVSGPVGTELTGYSLVLYNGNGGAPYNTVGLAGVIPETGVTVVDFPTNGLQNGSPDGVALVGPEGVIEFLSYEGTFTAVGGPADGLTSTDIGVSESSGTPAGDSLQRIDGAWTGPIASTFGEISMPPGEPPVEPPAPPTTLISAIQGSGHSSPFDGQVVTVEAIVVGDFQDGDADDSRNLSGFFLQEEDTDDDGDPATSEGIFVFDGRFGVDVMIGDRVRVTGQVDEYFGETQIDSVSNPVSNVTVVDAGNLLPAAAAISLPASGVTLNQAGRFQPDLEAFEGMRVVFTDELLINEMFQLDRFNEIKLVQGERPEQFTQANMPDIDDYEAYLESVGARQITYDDGLNVQNALIGNLDGFGPVFDTSTDIRMGDTVAGLTGVLDYKWAGNGASGSTWRVRAIEDGANLFEKRNARTDTPAEVGGYLKVASFNVLNYFATLDTRGAVTLAGWDPRGADNADELDRQTEKLVTSILALDADVIGLVELENDFGNGPGNAISRLVAALNDAAGPGTYDWAYPGTDLVGADAIANGFIYRPATVVPVGSPAVLDTPAFLDPNDTGQQRNRPAVAQAFESTQTGERFVAVVNHFKSKGSSGLDSSDATFALEDDDLGDGQGYWNDTRRKAALALADWLQTDPTSIDDPDTLILGDLNAYAMEDPIDALLASGYFNLEPEVDGPVYSFVFDGQTGTLDYALANPELLPQVSGVDIWRVNADEPDAIDYNTDFGRDPEIFDGTVPYRNSDHDPVLVGLSLDSVPPRIDIQLDKEVLWPPNGRQVTVTATVTASDGLDPYPTLRLVSVTSNEPDNGIGDGNTEGDIVILDDTRFALRAERSGMGKGRVYTITYEAVDATGNASVASAEVRVPKSQSMKRGR